MHLGQNITVNDLNVGYKPAKYFLMDSSKLVQNCWRTLHWAGELPLLTFQCWSTSLEINFAIKIFHKWQTRQFVTRKHFTRDTLMAFKRYFVLEWCFFRRLFGRLLKWCCDKRYLKHGDVIALAYEREYETRTKDLFNRNARLPW